MSGRDSTVADCGVSRSGVSVLVAVLERVVEYAFRRFRSPIPRTRSPAWGALPRVSLFVSVVPWDQAISDAARRKAMAIGTARRGEVRLIGSNSVWITDIAVGDDDACPESP